MSSSGVQSTVLAVLGLLCCTLVSAARPVESLFDDFRPSTRDKEQSKGSDRSSGFEASGGSKVEKFLDTNGPFHAAVLIAGTHGYENYRHQSDACHAYQILKNRGFTDDDVITFVYDDIAYNNRNPFPGRMYNRPGGYDVYPGCAKDYTGSNVNRDNIVAVLTGNAAHVAGKGSGRVLKGDATTRVFVFYSAHGSVGSVELPSGPHITGSDFYNTFVNMRQNRRFYELIFYLESCDSGSMFQGFRYEQQGWVFPVSASGPTESSYATYCPLGPAFPSPNPNEIGSCMGDLFSVSWMEFAEATNMFQQSILNQLIYTTQRTSVGGTYRGGSHVLLYSPFSRARFEAIANFLANYNPIGELEQGDGSSSYAQDATMLDITNFDEVMGVDQRDADLMYYVHQATRNDIADKDAAIQQLHDVLEARRKADRTIRSIVQYFVTSGLLSENTNSVEDYATTLLSRGEEQQVVDDWDCFKECIQAWDDSCGRLDAYSMQYTRTFANLCNAGIKVADFSSAAVHVCGGDSNAQPATAV